MVEAPIKKRSRVWTVKNYDLDSDTAKKLQKTAAKHLPSKGGLAGHVVESLGYANITSRSFGKET